MTESVNVASAAEVRKSISAAVEELCMAVAFSALAVVLLVGVFAMDSGTGYQAVGPAVFPLLVGTLGIICGLCLVVDKGRKLTSAVGTRRTAMRAHDDAHHGPAVPAQPRRRRWLGFIGLVVLLGTYAALLNPVGFWQLTGAMYACAARLFGSKRWLRNLVIGYALGLSVYLLFDRFLGVGLPDGYIRIAEW